MVAKKRFCGHCGSGSLASDKFCTSCGSELVAVSETSADPAMSPPQIADYLAQPDRIAAPEYFGGMTWMDKKCAFIVPDVPSPKAMSFVESVKNGFRKYAKFRGRASRSEYWYLWSLLPISLLGAGLMEFTGFEVATIGFGLLFWALIIPLIAAGVRRLHDTGHGGAWLLLSLIPFGSIVILVWLCQAGDDVPNRFGLP